MKRRGFLILTLLMLGLTACSNSPSASTKPKQTASPTQETISEAEQKDFVYKLVADKEAYNVGEKLDLYAELEYIGEEQQIDIYHAASPFHFQIYEQTRNFGIPYIMDQPLIKTTLKKGEPLKEYYKRSGGYSDKDDPSYIAFIKDFLENGFPEGIYEIKGSAQFYIVVDDKQQHYNLEDELKLEVK